VRASPLIRFLRERGLPSFVTAAVWFSSLFIVAWIISGWFWDRAAPRAVTLPTTHVSDSLEAAQMIAARHLMGEARNTPAGSVAAPRSTQFRLLGAMTAGGRHPGFAILAADGEQAVAVFEGDEVAPGVTLSKVLPESVLMRYGSRTETLGMSYPSGDPIALPMVAPRPDAATGRQPK
jgi:general secretion pathway protein C